MVAVDPPVAPPVPHRARGTHDISHDEAAATATGLVEAAEEQSQEPPGPLEATAAEPADPAVARPSGGATLGSTVHRTLEILDLGETTDQAVNQATTAACAELRAPHLAGDVRSRVQAALTAPIIQLAATHRHWKEVPIVAELRGRVVEGIIDLIVDTDDGLVIVDYKTDSTETATDHHGKGPPLHATDPRLRRGARARHRTKNRRTTNPVLQASRHQYGQRARRRHRSRHLSDSRKRVAPSHAWAKHLR